MRTRSRLYFFYYYAQWQSLLAFGPAWLTIMVIIAGVIVLAITSSMAAFALAICLLIMVSGTPVWPVGLLMLAGLLTGGSMLAWYIVRWDLMKRKQEEFVRFKKRQDEWQAWQAYTLAQERARREAAERIRLQWEAAERARREAAEQARIEMIARLNTLTGLLSLTPTEFEQIVGKMLESRGFKNVEHTGGSGDLAADLVCEDADGQKVVVQCKRYAPNNLIGSPDIQKFLGMMIIHHRAEMGIFITTSGFTIPALALGEQHSDRLFLIGGDGIVAMIQEYAASYSHE